MVIRTGILTVPEPDEQAVQVVSQRLQQAVPGMIIIQESNARSQRNWIEDILRRWCDEEELDLVITIGGTSPAPGPSADEIVPEATLAVVERLLPGLAEAMRAYAQVESELALLDRSIAGIRGRSIILNLPSGAAPAALFLEAVVELLGPLAACLQGVSSAPRLSDVLEIEQSQETDLSANPPTGQTKGLNAEEFAAFLQRGANRSVD
jgi:molybdopterin adenylyltransferase